MNWLEKHINLFFMVSGVLLIIDVIVGVLATLELGIPHNNPLVWTSYQWQLIDFLWKPFFIDLIISLLLIVLCFMKKYFVFPLLLLYSIFTLNVGITNIDEIIKYGFIYPIDNLSGIIGIMEFILAIIGTIFWIRKIMGKNMPVNG